MVIKEPPLEKSEIQLTENHRLRIDKWNFVFTERYQKRASRGKDAPFIDEYGYQGEKYLGSIKQVLELFMKGEKVAYLAERTSESERRDIVALFEMIEGFEARREEILNELVEVFNKNVTLIVEGKRRDPNAIHRILDNEGDND